MSEMIERVAKALWEVRRARAQTVGLYLEEWGDGYWPNANGIMEEARAAIEAMREPTEAMINNEMARCYNDGPYADKEVRRTYSAMIDAARQAK